MKVLNENNLSSLYQKIKAYMATKDDILDIAHPINSIYISTSSTSPATLFGGTWERFGNGRTIMSTQTTAEQTGGEEEVTLTTNQIPSHNHGEISLTGHVGEIADQGTSAQCNPSGIFSRRAVSGAVGYGDDGKNDTKDGFDADLSHEHSAEGGSNSHNNLQPYVTCYMWKRVS